LLGFIKGLLVVSVIIFCLGIMPTKIINQLNDDSTIYKIGNNIKKYFLKNAVNIQNEINDKGLSKIIQEKSLEIKKAVTEDLESTDDH